MPNTSAVNACGASESTAQGKSVSPQQGSATAKLYVGLGPMLEGIADLASSTVLASEKCTHGISFNDECSECEIDAALTGEQDSLAAADEDWGRLPR